MDRFWTFVKVIATFGTMVILLRLLFSAQILRFLGSLHTKNGFRPFSPNWITIYSLGLTLLGFYLFVACLPVVGLAVVILGAVLDRIDGKMAVVLQKVLAPPGKVVRHPREPPGKPPEGETRPWYVDLVGNVFADVTQNGGTKNLKIGRADTRAGEIWIEFNYNGTTDLGKVLDPFGDKVKIFVIVYTFASANLLDPWIITLMLLPEAVGTLMRRPFYLFKELQCQTRSSGVGKFKALTQWLAVVWVTPQFQGWIDADHWAYGLSWFANTLIGLAALLAIASVLSRLKPFRRNKQINQAIEATERSVQHEAVQKTPAKEVSR